MVRIMAEVEGIEQSEIPFKAVFYSEEKKGIKILAEESVEKDKFELEVGITPEKMPKTAKLAVVPQEIKKKSLIRRLVQSGHAPNMTISRDLMLAKEGKIAAKDVVMKDIGDLVDIFKLKQKVTGRVIKKNIVTGEDLGVPGATVRVLDVDLHLAWWYPHPGWPYGWIFPLIRFRREQIATAKTDECGNFSVYIPKFDIDAILRWRLRFRCLWDILKPPRVIDAIRFGVKPDISVYPELKRLPELKPKVPPKPWPDPDPDPFKQAYIKRGTSSELDRVSLNPQPLPPRSLSDQISQLSDKKFEPVLHDIFANQALFKPTKQDELSVLEKPAFPHSIKPPALPSDEKLLKILPEKRMLSAIRENKPLVRLIPCWADFVPEWQFFFDVPDIVFEVEQDIDGDGNLEVIYDQGYFDVNWNLEEPTTNIVLEARQNAIAVPCGAQFKNCTATGFVGINQMAIESSLLSNEGYALRVNRPKPNGIRPEAKTPFCGNLLLAGCPEYEQQGVAYYRVFYKYESNPEARFMESWYVWEIGTSNYPVVQPDAEGFYSIEYTQNQYYPYHVLMHWPTSNYPHGKYKVRLELYDAGKNLIDTETTDVNLVLDNSIPSKADFLGLRWRNVGETSWTDLSLTCPIIRRGPGTDIELETTYTVAAEHLRDYYISFQGCGGGVGSQSYWHHTVDDNSIPNTPGLPDDGVWRVTVSHDVPQGGYSFYLEGRSRAFDANGGIGVNWEIDPIHIYRTNSIYVVILDE